MSDEAGSSCTCRPWRDWPGAKNFPLWFDPKMNEWSLLYTTPQGLGFLIFTYCPLCGKPMPKSLRGDFFTKPADSELEEVRNATSGVESLAELEAKLGLPDHDFAWPEASQPDPEIVPVRRQLTYSKRWKTLQLIAQEGSAGEVRFTVVGQYVPEGVRGGVA